MLTSNRKAVVLVLAAAAIMIPGRAVHAGVYSNNELWQMGKTAYEQHRFLDAAMYLFAYQQREPARMEDPQHANQLRNALQYAVVNAQADWGGSKGDAPGAAAPPASSGTPPPLDDVAQNAAAVHPKAYCLVCRGGRSMTFDYRASDPRSGDAALRINFERGLQGVGKNWEKIHQLEAGQCAWLDRGIQPGEPRTLLLSGAVFKPKKLQLVWGGSGGGSIGADESHAYASWLIRPETLHSFYAYNDGRGSLVVTRIGEMRR